jgi:adenosylmethionine-8-amino-7-oxononanoate aminotransferase
MAYSTEQLRALDKRHIWHPFTHMKQWLEDQPLVITAAEGMELIDSDGRRYLDGVSSLWCNVHGHRVPEIDSAIRAQLDRVAHTTLLGLASEPSILLAERLMKIVPPGLAKVFYSDAGATATEIAFKLAVQYWHNIGRPAKTQFIGLSEAYHGDTTGAMSVGRTPAFHKPYFPLLFKVHFAPTPFVYRWDERFGTAVAAQPAAAGGTASVASRVRDHCLAEMERLLEAHHEMVAAVCVEPVVQGAAGMIVQPPGYLRGVRELCDRYGVLLIADEVATGFGRTGRMFACEHEGVAPDLMCVAKGITGGYLPLAATFATQAIFDAFLGEPWEGRTFFHGHTYTGNPLACAAALASLELFEQRGLVRQVAAKAEALAGMLRGLLDLPHVGDIRQKGLMVGIELVADRRTRAPFDPRRRTGAAVCAAIRRHGVLIRPLGDVLVLMPPLAMELPDLQRLVDAVRIEVGRLDGGGLGAG